MKISISVYFYCKESEEIVGIGGTADGGVTGFASFGYIICRYKNANKKSCRIACSKSKVSKRSIPANEAL